MALVFDGFSSYLDLGNVLDIDGSGSFTFGGRFQRAVAGVRHEIASKEDGDPDGWEMSILGSNLLEFGVFNGVAYPVVNSTSTFGAGSSGHVVGVYDDTAGQLQMWVNGVLEATVGGFSGSVSSQNFNIGRRPDGTRLFNGQLEDVRTYDRALTAAEIRSWAFSNGRDRVLDGKTLHLGMLEKPPGAIPTGILNPFVASGGGSSAVLAASYTVPAGLNNPLLVVAGGGDAGSETNVEAASATFAPVGALAKRIGAANSGGAGFVGSSLFTVPVTAGDSGLITINWPGAINGRAIHALTVEGGLDVLNAANSSFNNSGNTTTSLTTTAANLLGITHLTTGQESTAIGTTGPNHSLETQAVLGAPSSGFSSHFGSWPAPVPATHSAYGFTFGAPAPNRSVMTMMAIETEGLLIPDQSPSHFNATPNGTLQYAASLEVGP